MNLTPTTTNKMNDAGFFYNRYSPRIFVLTNDKRKLSPVCWFTFDNQVEAKAFSKSILSKNLCTRARLTMLNQSSRVLATCVAVEVSNMCETTLEKLIQRDRNRQ